MNGIIQIDRCITSLLDRDIVISYATDGGPDPSEKVSIHRFIRYNDEDWCVDYHVFAHLLDTGKIFGIEERRFPPNTDQDEALTLFKTAVECITWGVRNGVYYDKLDHYISCVGLDKIYNDERASADKAEANYEMEIAK